MSHFKDIFGTACLGAAYRTAEPFLHPKHIKRTTRYENSELTEKYTDSSIAGGAIRGALISAFLKGAKWGLGKTVSERTKKYGDGFVDYVVRLRGEEPRRIDAPSPEAEESRPSVSDDITVDRSERDERNRQITDGLFGGGD